MTPAATQDRLVLALERLAATNDRLVARMATLDVEPVGNVVPLRRAKGEG